MKRTWRNIIIALLAPLVLVSTAAPVLAQTSDDGTVEVEARCRKALAIDAPRRAEVGETVTMTVSQRGTEDPVKDANVWALTRSQATTLKAELATIRESGDQASLMTAVEERLRIEAIFIGTTNGAGKVRYAFENAGGYLLVALKKDHFPGFRPIVIGAPTTDNADSNR